MPPLVRGIHSPQTLKQGATFELLFVQYDTAPVETIDANGNVVITPGVVSDLTGMTFEAHFREREDSAVTEAEIPSTAWKVEDRTWEKYGTLPTLVGPLSAEQTARMRATSGVFDVMVTQGATRREFAYGNYTLIRAVTR